MPSVSIIIPLYNAEKHIAQCVESAINQLCPDKEIIIIDDGSSDNSLIIAKQYERENIKVFTQKNQGASIARNNGILAARGDYFQFLDADDYLSADKIDAQLKILAGSKTKLAMCKTLHFYDGENELLRSAREDWYCKDTNDPVDFLTKLYAGKEVMPGYGGMIQPNAWLTPRELIEKAGFWNEFRCPDDDGEFFCRIILASEGIRYSDNGINYYRKFRNNNSLSGQQSLDAHNNVVLSINLKHKYLKAASGDPVLIDRIFARHYWERGLNTYPNFKSLSDYCIRKAVEMGYEGDKYIGGPKGRTLTKYLGWKITRTLLYYQQAIKHRLFPKK